MLCELFYQIRRSISFDEAVSRINLQQAIASEAFQGVGSKVTCSQSLLSLTLFLSLSSLNAKSRYHLNSVWLIQVLSFYYAASSYASLLSRYC